MVFCPAKMLLACFGFTPPSSRFTATCRMLPASSGTNATPTSWPVNNWLEKSSVGNNAYMLHSPIQIKSLP